MINRYLNNFLKIIFITFISKIIFVCSVNADSLSDVAKKAIPNHPSIIAQMQLLKAAKIGIREAKAGYLPSVDMRLGGSRARTNSSTTRGRATRPTDRSSQSKVLTRKEGSLTVSQMIFDGFATKNLVGAAASRYDLANEQILELAQGVSLRLAAAYVGVTRDRALLSLAEKNIKRHADIIEQIQIQVDSGGATAADLDQARARIEGAKAIYMQMGGRLRDSEAGYLEAVGALPGNIIFPKPDNQIFGFSEGAEQNNDQPKSLVQTSDEYNVALEKILDIAMEKNHSLNSARLTIDSVMSTRKAAKSPFLPRVDLQLLGSRTQNVGGSPGMSSDHVATFNFTYNFYRGGGDTARLESSKASLAESRARLLEAKRLIEQSIRISFNAWNTSRSQLPSLDSRVEASQAALDSYKEQFSLGKRTLLEVLNAENEVFGARSALAEGRATVLLAQYQVLAATGTLTNYLGVDIFGKGKPVSSINQNNKKVNSTKVKNITQPSDKIKSSTPKKISKEELVNNEKKIQQKNKLDSFMDSLVSNSKVKLESKKPIALKKESKDIYANKDQPIKILKVEVPGKIYIKTSTETTNSKTSLNKIIEVSMAIKPGVVREIFKPINLIEKSLTAKTQKITTGGLMKNVSLKPAFINKSNKTNDLNSRKILNKEKIVSKVNTDNIEKSNVKSKLKERIATIINERPNSVKGLDESKIILQENIQKVKPVVIQRPPAFLPGESL